DATAAASSAAPDTSLRNVRGDAPITVDVTDVVRAALRAGNTRLTLRLQLDAPSVLNPVVIHSSTDLLHQTGLKITTAAQPGVVADLFDAGGHRLAQGEAIIDTQARDAGAELLRSYRPGL